MDLKITKQEKSALPRMEAEAIVKFEHMTPSRQELIKAIAKKLNSKVELVIVKKIYNSYGDREAVIYAYVYDNDDAMKSLENKKMIEKNVIKKEKSKESQPAQDSEQKKAPKEEEKTAEKPKVEEKKAESSSQDAEPNKVEGE